MVVSPTSSFSSQETLPVANEPEDMQVESTTDATMNIGIFSGVSSAPPLLTEIAKEQQQRDQAAAKSPLTSILTKLPQRVPTAKCNKAKRKHRQSMSWSSLNIVPDDSDSSWMSTDMQHSIVTLASQPTKTFQVFDDLSVRTSITQQQSLPNLPPLDEYFEETKEEAANGNNSNKGMPTAADAAADDNGATIVVVADDLQENKAEKVAVAMHDPKVVDFLVDYCEE